MEVRREQQIYCEVQQCDVEWADMEERNRKVIV